MSISFVFIIIWLVGFSLLNIAIYFLQKYINKKRAIANIQQQLHHQQIIQNNLEILGVAQQIFHPSKPVKAKSKGHPSTGVFK